MCLSTYNSYIFVCVKVTSNQFSPYVRRRALRIKSHAATRCNTQQHRDTAPNSNTLNKWRQALSLEESCCESKQKNATCVGLFHHTFITLSSQKQKNWGYFCCESCGAVSVVKENHTSRVFSFTTLVCGSFTTRLEWQISLSQQKPDIEWPMNSVMTIVVTAPNWSLLWMITTCIVPTWK